MKDFFFCSSAKLPMMIGLREIAVQTFFPQITDEGLLSIAGLCPLLRKFVMYAAAGTTHKGEKLFFSSHKQSSLQQLSSK